MAEGAWIPAYDSIWTHQKTRKLANALRMPVNYAVGTILRLYVYARDHYPTGDLAGIDPELLARVTDIGSVNDRGNELRDRGVRFLNALVEAGFLKGETLHISGWEDGPGKLVEKRARDRDRTAQRREEERRERETKAREKDIAEARQRRIDEARSAAEQVRPGAVEAHPQVRAGAPAGTPGRSEGAVGAHEKGGNTPELAPRPTDVRATSQVEKKEERDNPLPLTGSGRGRGLTRVSGKPACGRCRDEWFVHRSQVRDTNATYAGDCSPCAKRGAPCPGYTSEVIDPDIPDERKANA